MIHVDFLHSMYCRSLGLAFIRVGGTVNLNVLWYIAAEFLKCDADVHLFYTVSELMLWLCKGFRGCGFILE